MGALGTASERGSREREHADEEDPDEPPPVGRGQTWGSASENAR
jgi:hypothetical protein